MKKLQTVAVVLGLCAAVGQVQAAVAAAQSDSTYVQVGATAAAGPGHPGQAGQPGIGVHNVANFTKVAFSGLQQMVPADANGVTKIAASPGSHRDMGDFNFTKVANSDVYFGEWSQTGNVADGTHTVYYAGQDKTTNMPTTGQADYAVVGINNYSGNNLLTGTFKANFATNQLSGAIANSGLSVAVNANINSADASFKGNALANGSVTGKTQGHFFGHSAAQLAGIATFADRSKDVSFGGSKKP